MATTRDSVETNFSNLLEQWKNSSIMVPASTSKYLADKDNTGDPSKVDWFWKISLCGDGKVGKTSIRERYLGHELPGSYSMTIGADFVAKKTEIAGNSVMFQIWDIAGQPYFKSVRKTYYKGSHGSLVVFDLTNRQSFENVPLWINEVWTHNRSNNGGYPIPIVILGNKNDLITQKNPVVSHEEISQQIMRINEYTRRKFNFEINYIPTSAKTGENISEAFKYLATHIMAVQRFAKK